MLDRLSPPPKAALARPTSSCLPAAATIVFVPEQPSLSCRPLLFLHLFSATPAPRVAHPTQVSFCVFCSFLLRSFFAPACQTLCQSLLFSAITESSIPTAYLQQESMTDLLALERQAHSGLGMAAVSSLLPACVWPATTWTILVFNSTSL